MPPRPRSAPKLPLLADASDDTSDDAASGGSLSEWEPSPSPPRVETTGTSSASEEAGPVCVIAPPPGETQFRSWEEFEAYFAQYQARSFQIYRTRTNTSVPVRNARIYAQGSKACKNPDEWDQYAKTYACTHYGKFRSQATSKRPRQESRASGCSAQINVCVQEINKATHTFALMITKCHLEHNHTLNEYAFKSHSSNRVSLDESALETVDELCKAGAKKTSILKFIKDNSDSNPKPQDVHNLVRKLKAREQGLTPTSNSKRLKKWMSEFGDVSGNVGRIFVDDVGEKTAFPGVTILLCQFHVLKYLRKESSSSDYGCNTWERNQLRGLMDLLVYAKTEKEYMGHFRLGASWKQLKEWVNSFMAVDECIASIMYYQTLQERRFMDEVYKKVNIQHVEYDQEMTLVANLVSEHASSIEFESSSDNCTSMESFAIRRVVATDDRPWDSNRKYREALPIASEICGSMSGLGMAHYREAMEYLKDVARRFKHCDFGTLSSQNQNVQLSDSSPSTQPAEASSAIENSQVEESDIQSGESGIQSGESGTQSGESGTQFGKHYESKTRELTSTLQEMPEHFQVDPDSDILAKLKAIPLLSVQAEALELVGKSPLGDCTANTLVLKLFAERVDTIGVDTSIAGNVMNGYLSIYTMKGVFVGVT
ncbi:uncharacterized protein PITG_23336, partial [Phytophthora infestans T30-4]